MADLPLILMLDFLDEVAIEREVLKDVARVEAVNLQYHTDQVPERVGFISFTKLSKRPKRQ
jgi:hypothetical protein